MGSWDCYCAICGGPFGGAQISRKPRTARFRRRQERRAQHDPEEEEEAGDNENTDEEENDNESLDSGDEEYSYDPDIISEEDTLWTCTLHILGFNANAPGVSKAFVSGPGSYSDYGGVVVEPGNDPNFNDDGLFSCYYDFNNGDPVFPFHWCCYELLARALTGTPDVGKIDKDLLFNVMHELAPDYTCRLDLNYGNPGPLREQFWESTPGREFIVVHPTAVPNLVNLIRTTIASSDFKLPSSDYDLGPRVKHDPFTKVPYDLIYKISCLLPLKSLIDLGKASWPVHSVLRNNDSFWQERIKRTMPWFLEVQELLNNPENLRGKDCKGLLLWADKITTPRINTAGSFLGITNRRRIWDVCEQLAALYLPRWHQKDEPRPGFVENMIRTQSACVYLPVVSSPQPNKKDLALAYWVRSWEDMYTRKNVVEIFWNLEGSLAGISVTPDSQRRLFGKDDTNEGVSRQTVEIEKGDWIIGFILHIPEMNLYNIRRIREPGDAHGSANLVCTSTSTKGITILYKSGTRTHLGATEMGYSKRPLLVSKGMNIVGVMGQTGPIQGFQGKEQIIRIGLLQAERPELNDYSVVPENYSVAVPQPPPLERCLWRHDYSSIFQTKIWEDPALRLLTYEGSHSESLLADVHDDVVPHEALIWAKDVRELRSVTRLSGYVVVGGTVSSFDNGQSWTRPYDDLCGVRAEFTTEYDVGRRLIGIQKEEDGSDWLEDHCVHFDIDGPGGEYVNEVSFAMYQTPKAVKLRTNRGREVYWGEKLVSNWKTLRPPNNETVVGIVMTFANPSGWSWETKTYTHTKQSSIAALTLPLGIVR